jgi:regulator of nucleoside diphosphate kinase
MDDPHDVYLSAPDARALAAMLRSRRRDGGVEPRAYDELGDLLSDARIGALEQLPADRVTIGSTVTYAEQPSGARQTVTLADPQRADAARGRISVLSPIGLALIGRRPGSVVLSGMQSRQQFNIRVLEASRDVAPSWKAAARRL